MTLPALRPMQREMAAHMLTVPRCGVWAGMGSGKTRATLEALLCLYIAGAMERTLVLGPKRVAESVWPEESRKWTPELTVEFIGGPKRAEILSQSHATVHSINYELLPWLVTYYGDRWPYDTVVADEATKLRGFRLRQGGQRTRALGKVAHRYVRRFIEPTGTPAPNGLEGLWGQVWFLDSGERLGRTYTAFTQRWFRQGYDGFSIEPLPHAQADIQRQLADVCITIDPRDHMDVREPIVNTIFVDLPPKAMKLYREMEKRMYIELGDLEVEAFNAAAKTNKCLQLANGAIYTDDTGHWEEVHEAKLDALESIVEEANGMPVLVAYNFKSDLARILKKFPKARELDAKPKTITDWNAGRIPILCAHPASAGHGLNLQDGGNILAVFGQTWDLELYMQMVERIGSVRQAQAGHNRAVYIYHIVARDTVDELVMARRETKRTVQDLLLESMKRRNSNALH